MMNSKDYTQMQELKNCDPYTYQLFESLFHTYSSELSIASHNLKNSLSFIYSSYQIIRDHYPETKDFIFWEDIGEAITNIVHFLDRMSVYRYSYKVNASKINLSNLLYELPDGTDAIMDTQSRSFAFDTESEDIEISADYRNLKQALVELMVNSCEACEATDTITISSRLGTDKSSVTITISNPGSLNLHKSPSKKEAQQEPFDIMNLCTPFYTTKPEHAGLGLSIANIVCRANNGTLTIAEENGTTKVSITLPVSY